MRWIGLKSKVVSSMRSRKCPLWLVVGVLGVVGTRFGTTVYHIEDIDSLRFAMSAIEFNVLENKPHFPGYPLFVGLLQAVHSLFKSVALSFSLVGVLATLGFYFAAVEIVKLTQVPVSSRVLFVVVAFNPLLWLMGNRYMPDLMGLCVLHWCLVFLLKCTEVTKHDHQPLWPILLGVSASILCGVRLSYLPFLLPGLMLLKNVRVALGALAMFTLATAAWLGIWIYEVGYSEFVELAKHDSLGHFTQWGGTVYATELTFSQRLAGAAESIWAHAMGMWMPGRSAWTFLNALALSGLTGLGIQVLWSQRKRCSASVLYVWLCCCICYAIWAFFFQNITYKPRHILPLLLPVFVVLAAGVTRLSNTSRWSFRTQWPELALFTYMICGVHIGVQHVQPAAIDQVRDHVLASSPTVVYCPDHLIRYYLKQRSPQLHVSFVKDISELNQSMVQDEDAVLLSTVELSHLASCFQGTYSFHHNPFVNRLWSSLSVHEYCCKKAAYLE